MVHICSLLQVVVISLLEWRCLVLFVPMSTAFHAIWRFSQASHVYQSKIDLSNKQQFFLLGMLTQNIDFYLKKGYVQTCLTVQDEAGSKKKEVQKCVFCTNVQNRNCIILSRVAVVSSVQGGKNEVVILPTVLLQIPISFWPPQLSQNNL